MTNSLAVEATNKLRDFYKGPITLFGVFLFTIFGTLDYFFYPTKFQILFSLRLAVVAIVLVVNVLLRLEFAKGQSWVLGGMSVAALAAGLSLFAMTWIIDSDTAVYWVGLLLLVTLLGLIPSLPFRLCVLLILFTVLPFTLYAMAKLALEQDLRYLLGIFFLNGTAVLAIGGRWHVGKLEKREFELRMQLADEIENRGVIIERKTAEALRLRSFSKQFSPQIVAAIEDGSIQLDGPPVRKEICAIFVDIKDSTKKVATLGPDSLEKVLSMYLTDVAEIMLSRDMTIDKFLGDGVFGFTNSPKSQDDFVERALDVALAIKHHFEVKREIYASLWTEPLEFRIGIALGVASIGFYGDERHLRSFTAIGKVINLASRLNGVAEVNGISLSGEVVEHLRMRDAQLHNRLDLEVTDRRALRGFDESVEVWKLRGYR